MIVALIAAALALPLPPAATAARDTAYFQQGIDYRIEARLDEATHVLSGRARLHYTNRAPAALDTLWFHLHLNAFRPHSAWARRELEYGERRFQDLGSADHAYERLRTVTIDGAPVAPVYPGAPDSTVVGFPLASPLAPGAAVVVAIDWDARLSTLPRRQGRYHRHYDFAQWYPRVAVFDRGGWQVQPLLPQGEFYGEFGRYDVTIELAVDQVVGATGVPVEGDPGWAGEALRPGSEQPDYRRDHYAPVPAVPLGLLHGEAGAGRKRVRWRAEDVHHFAWSTSPHFVYEGGTWRGVAVHVLYQRGDTEWPGEALERTFDALAFYDTIFGSYPYPHVTNVHRIESGGTEFPMLVMNGSATPGLIVHEVGHLYAHGILANNEWRDAWLDEGLVTFLTHWFREEEGHPPAEVWGSALQNARTLERLGRAQPIAIPSADFADPQIYGTLTYTKAALVFRMLRGYVGEAAFRAALRDYFERNRFRHVGEADLRASLQRAAGEELGWFFHQWLHTTGTLDYRIGAATTARGADGRWTTRVEVIRDGENWMPVELQVGTQRHRLDSRDRVQVIIVETAARPDVVVLDPDEELLEVDVRNNRRTL